MSRRYTYSRSIHTFEGQETYTAEQFDSFDEAKKAVDKGIHDRKLELAKTAPAHGIGALTAGPIGGPSRENQAPAGK